MWLRMLNLPNRPGILARVRAQGAFVTAQRRAASTFAMSLALPRHPGSSSGEFQSRSRETAAGHEHRAREGSRARWPDHGCVNRDRIELSSDIRGGAGALSFSCHARILTDLSVAPGPGTRKPRSARLRCWHWVLSPSVYVHADVSSAIWSHHSRHHGDAATASRQIGSRVATKLARAS